MATSYMPEEMVFQILLWLPVVSLLRFKSVCKSWHSIIRSSNFITQHLQHHHHQHDLIVMDPGWNAFQQQASSATTPPSKPLYAGLISSEEEIFQLLDLPPGVAPSNNKNHHHPWMLNLVGSCHGIVCLHREDDNNVFLWNPSTHQSRALPQPPLPWPTRPDTFHPSVAVGFGFDFNSNDYKVVRFNIPSDGNSTGFRLDVYSLNTDSWRNVENAVLPPVGVSDLMSSPKAAYQDSIFCWLGVNKIWGSDSYGLSTLLSFDFSSSNEEEMVLSTTPLPESINKCISLHLTIVKGDMVCIRMVKEFENEEEEGWWWFEMWKLNDFGVKESWVKLHVIGPFPILDWVVKLPPNPHFQVVRGVIGFPKNEKLLVLLWDGQVRSCNPFTRQTNTPILTSHIFLQATTYHETLLSIHPPS